jgi:iron(III) transport system ATP-binding protein
MLWTLHNVTLWGRGRPRLDQVSVEIPAGRVAIVGASGSGKTSLLNLLVGFEQAGEGTLSVGSFALSDGSSAASVSLNPQSSTFNPQRSPFCFWSPPDYGLWPHLTVREHLTSVSPDPYATRVTRLLLGFGLETVSSAYPASLSQGECSRLSVARSLAAEPRCLVLDEPLEHVDTALRDQCWRVLREEVATTGASLVFSTHAPDRVLSEAEWCLCLDEGRLVWAGPVEELYDRPGSPEVARFLGPCNWLAEERSAVSGQQSARESPPVATGGLAVHSATHPVRPERLQIVFDEGGPYRVESERFSGHIAEVELLLLVNGTTQTVYHRPPRPVLATGQRVSLRILALICAVAMCLGLSGCLGSSGAAELPVVDSTIIRIPVDGKRMPAPRALTVSKDRELYVLDDSGRILVYDEANTLIREWNMPESSVGKPEGIRVLQDGRVAIADTHYHRVVFFSKQGELLSMFGRAGEKPGEFTYPVDLMQDPSGFLYVAEYGGSDRIQKFAPDGKFVLEFGGLGTEIGKFQRPSGMVWLDSKIYVADAINSRVQVFSDQGQPLEVLDWAEQGGLYYPYDISLSPHGQFFFVEYGACRVTVADPHGKLVAQFGHEGRGHHELWTPWALAVSEDNRLFIADTGNRRIVQLTLPGGRL